MKRVKIQCGYEDICKAKSCLDCHRYMRFKNRKLTLAEAICIEDFGVVWLSKWEKENKKGFELAQNVMRKLDKRVNWK
jgi:hypothetical protein